MQERRANLRPSEAFPCAVAWRRRANSRVGAAPTGELARDHRRVPLPDQPFRLLALLIRERGTLVTRDLALMRVTEVADVVAIDLGPSSRP